MPEIALHQYENEIDHLIEEARYLEALAHTRHILRQHPRYIGAYYLLGKTMLEADQPELAIDMFQRALNADPEHLRARIGLTMAHQRVDNLNAAIWNLERAIELNPGNADLIDELRQLYGRRDGFEPERVPLNRAGLAHLYMRGNRPGRAVEELRALLVENPQRLDLRLALAEAYWRDDQIVQAADACQVLLDDAHYCLKANLLLGALWIDSGQEEGQTYLNRAQEIDIENILANEMFGAASPLKRREVSIDHLTYRSDTLNIDQQAKWFQKLEAASVSVSLAAMQPEMTESEARLVDITAGLEAQIEIPDWLRELGTEEDGALSWMADIGAEVEAGEPIAEAQAPDWLQAGEVAEITTEEELPDWLSAAEPEEAALEVDVKDLGLEEDIAVSEAMPDWLQALEPAALAAEEIPLSAEGVPDWLSELKRPDEAVEAVEGAPSEEMPDWLQSLQPAAPTAEEAAAVELEEEELPDWMEDIGSVGETAEQALATEEGVLPDWLTGFQAEETAAVIPTEEALDWLGELEAGSEVVPGVVPEEAAPGAGVPDWLYELQPVETQAAEVPAEELPDWLNELQPAAQPEAGAETVEEDLLEWLDEIPAEEAIVTAEEALPVGSALGEEVGEEIAEQLAEELAPNFEEAPGAEGFFGWEAFGEEITEVEAARLDEEAESILDWATLAEQAVESKGEIVAVAPVVEDGAVGALLSGDDALAWLESLTAGKEEELRAQAEAEAQIRVAEILGHKPEPRVVPPVTEEPTPTTEEAAVAEGFFGWEAFGEEIAEAEATPLIEEEEVALDWESLAEQLEETEGEVAAATPVAEGDDVLAWLEGPAEAEAAEPEPLAEAFAPDLEEAPVAEGFFGWEAFGEEIAEVEAAPLEEEEGILEWKSLAERLEEGAGEIVAAPPVAEGDFMSGDDALAWLESLAIGKEDELRAQAEIETQARVAEILGDKPAPKPAAEPLVDEPVIAVEKAPAAEGFFGWESFGEEIAEVETPAPAIEEVVASDAESIAEGDFLSGDDALAWLGSLAAGKEDELRAQAEVETQARVAEILGRKPEPRDTEPAIVAPAPVIEEPAAPVAPVEPEVAAEVPVAEGDVMSGDDALAWLSSLAAGKEKELRAQAEVETQARVAEILGRKVEPTSRPQVTAPEPIVEEARVEEAGPAAEGALLPGTAALMWLESFAEGREEELRAQAEAEAEVRVAEILGRKPQTTVAEAPKAEPEVTPKVLLTEAEPGEEAEYTGLLAQARTAWRAGDVDTALARYGELIQAEARLDDVIADLQQAATAQPKNGALLQLLGDAYMAHGMIDQAIKIFNQAMDLL